MGATARSSSSAVVDARSHVAIPVHRPQDVVVEAEGIYYADPVPRLAGLRLSRERAARLTRKWSNGPSSLSPHPFRRASITHHPNEAAPETAVGNRANVSQDVYENHYDQRTKQENMEQRRKFLDKI